MRNILYHIIISFLIGCGCTCRAHIPLDEVEYITFYTTNRTFERNSAIHSFDFFVEWNKDSLGEGSLCRDTIVRDKASIERFVTLVNSLQINNNKNYDLRTVAIIHLINDSTIHVGFGYQSGICIEGVVMNDNEELFQYLEDSIYKYHPPEYWMGEWLKDFIHGKYDDIISP